MLSEFKDWELPQLKVGLNRDEYLLIDWILCGASRLIPNIETDELVNKWHPLRMRVWDKFIGDNIKKFTDEKAEQDVPMDTETARFLLGIAPTTFRWGTGADCGLSLKLKLAEFLHKEGENH